MQKLFRPGLLTVTAAAAILLAAALPRPALATDDLIEVFPTGDPGQDIDRIQDAVAMVSEGGTVLLRATAIDGTPTPFNFGQVFPATVDDAFAQREENSVIIKKSVRIIGENLDDDDDEEEFDGGGWTTLEGGFEPFLVLAPEKDVVIERINFTCTRYKVIAIQAGRNVVIRNNRFGKVTFFETDFVFGWPRTFGVAVATDTGSGVVSAETVLMERNEVDLNPGTPCRGLANDPDQDELGNKLGFGLFAANVDGKVIIQHNTVSNTARTGINLADSRGLAIVRQNIVDMGERSFRSPSGLGSTGINSGAGFLSQEGQRGVTIISNNKVTCENKDCTGISVGDITTQRGRAVVTANHILMGASELPELQFAAGIEAFIGNSIFAFNRIEGRSNFAVLLEGDIGTGTSNLADNNRVIANSVRGFTPLSTDFFGIMLSEPADYALFFANNNLLAGREGKVFDLGQDNVIRGGLEVINGGS